MTGDQQNKTIGIVTNTSWNIWNFRMDLIRYLESSGMHLLIFAPEGPEYNQIKEAGFQFIPLKKLHRGATNPLLDGLFMIELYQKFKRFKMDLVLLYTPKPNIYGSMVARWTGLRSIATITGLGYTFNSEKLASWVIKKLYKEAHKKSDLVVFHNSDDHQLFLQNNWVKVEKSKVIDGSGVNTDKFSPVKSKNGKDHFHFLFAGRLLYDKGIVELLKAFESISKKYDHVFLNIVGEVDIKNPSAFNKNELTSWLKNNKRIKHFEGIRDIRPFIAASDVVVLPSYREGMPKTILESMAMGKPIIVSDVPGCRQTVVGGINGNGFLCKSKDYLSLAQQMERIILIDPEKRIQMGKTSRRRAIIHYDSRIINKEYLDAINIILSQEKHNNENK